MKKVCQLLDLPRTNGNYGVEIEIEGSSLPVPGGNWRTDQDGSLRGESYEYVMRSPKSLSNTLQDIDHLYKSFSDNGSTIYESVHAGVHVHVNVQDMDIRQVFTFATLYFIMEEILVKYCGEMREGNHFCLRLQDACGLEHFLKESVKGKDILILNHEDIRYSSLNFNALFRYGSLEFRSMRSTGDKEAIKNWVMLLDKLKVKSLECYSNPVEVVQDISIRGEGLLPFIFEELYPLVEGLVEIPHKSMLSGARSVQDIVYAIDWEEQIISSTNPFAQVNSQTGVFF